MNAPTVILAFDDPALPTRYEIAADMADHLRAEIDRDGFDLGDERCIHDALDVAGFDPVDIADAGLVEAAIDRVRRLRLHS